jgi:transglutaminase-like putative cysteine protease
MTILTVLHRTTYRYANQVSFGEHRLMMRPRDSHDLRLIETGLSIWPPATVRWIHDVFGNSVALASFRGPGSELEVESRFRAQHYPLHAEALAVEEFARRYPFSYDADAIPDLGRAAERHYPDPLHQIDTWARSIVAETANHDTVAILVAMTRAIKQRFLYNPRDAMGTQEPLATLRTGSGNCRDYALFLMEAARSLGFAARFVSGYLYDSNLGREEEGVVGAGSIHAWVQIYLPGAGWVEFDPTNGLVGVRDLIRVAVTRDPRQAVPLSGSFTGLTGDFLGVTVQVVVTAEPETD